MSPEGAQYGLRALVEPYSLTLRWRFAGRCQASSPPGLVPRGLDKGVAMASRSQLAEGAGGGQRDRPGGVGGGPPASPRGGGRGRDRLPLRDEGPVSRALRSWRTFPATGRRQALQRRGG